MIVNFTELNFDITVITETRTTKQVSILNNLNLNNYSYEYTPTETSPNGTLLFAVNHFSYKCHNHLIICQKNVPLLNLSALNSQCGSQLQTSIYGPYWL